MSQKLGQNRAVVYVTVPDQLNVYLKVRDQTNQGQAWTRQTNVVSTDRIIHWILTNQTEIFLNYVKLGLRLIGNRSKRP